MGVYLLHVDPPFNNRRHYIGYTKGDSPDRRLLSHQKGVGCKYTKRLVKEGCKLSLAYFWPTGDMKFEYFLKRLGVTKYWCPVCGLNKFPLPTPETMHSLPSKRTIAR
jgi:predicted GIY-YIG superfamily endonuclease